MDGLDEAVEAKGDGETDGNGTIGIGGMSETVSPFLCVTLALFRSCDFSSPTTRPVVRDPVRTAATPITMPTCSPADMLPTLAIAAAKADDPAAPAPAAAATPADAAAATPVAVAAAAAAVALVACTDMACITKTSGDLGTAVAAVAVTGGGGGAVAMVVGTVTG